MATSGLPIGAAKSLPACSRPHRVPEPGGQRVVRDRQPPGTRPRQGCSALPRLAGGCRPGPLCAGPHGRALRRLGPCGGHRRALRSGSPGGSGSASRAGPSCAAPAPAAWRTTGEACAVGSATVAPVVVSARARAAAVGSARPVSRRGRRRRGGPCGGVRRTGGAGTGGASRQGRGTRGHATWEATVTVS